MTAQRRERLIYNNKEYYIATEPLFPYLKSENIKFAFYSTACWRGYIGKWLIENSKLYLTELKANTNKQEESGLDYLFPGETKVFAGWFSGEIRIPYGEIMQYVHQGYASLYEKELYLKIEKGLVVSQYEVDNTHFYKDRKGMEKRSMDDLVEAIFGVKPKKRKGWFNAGIKKICALFAKK